MTTKNKTMDYIVEVENLSQVERNLILSVLEKDEVLQDAQSQKVRALNSEIQKIRMLSILKAGDDNTKMCIRCREEFGFVFNRGTICPGCRFRICRMCQVALFNGSWLCTLCYKQRQLKWLTGEWTNFRPSPLKKWASGSDLVKASLRFNSGVGSEPSSPTRKNGGDRTSKDGSNGVLSGGDSDKQRVGYPKETDKHKLTQLLGGVLRGGKRPEEEKKELNVKRVSSRRYSESDTDSSSSSDVEDSVRSSPIAFSNTESEIDASKGLESPRSVDSPRLLKSVHEEKSDKKDGSYRGQDGKSVSKHMSDDIANKHNGHSALTRKGVDDRLTKQTEPSKDSHSKSRLQAGIPTVSISKSADSSLSSEAQSEQMTKKSHSHMELKSQPKAVSKETLLAENGKKVRKSAEELLSAEQVRRQTKASSPGPVQKEVRHKKGKVQNVDPKMEDDDETAKRTLLSLSAETSQMKKEQVTPEIITETAEVYNVQDGESEQREYDVTDSPQVVQRSGSPYSISMDSIPSSHPSPSQQRSLCDSSIPDSSDTDSVSKHSQQEFSELSGTESLVREEAEVDEDFVVEEISKVRFQRMSKKVGQMMTVGKLSRSPKKHKTARRESPQTISESSVSQDDSGHASGGSRGATPEHQRTDSGYSQSSIPSSLSTVTDNEEEEDIDRLVANLQTQNFGSRGNLLSVVADSRESIASFYSDAGDIAYSKIPVSGEILFGLNYNYKTGMLEVAVKQCRDIAAVDAKRNRSDPYVKTYLLPDKTRSGKRKTKVKKHTLNPTFDETLKYSISKSELENRTLWVTIWHNDRFGRNDFLGEVTINFDYYKFDDPAVKWYPLQERLDCQQMSMMTYKGDLIMSMRFVPAEKLTDSPVKKGKQKKDSIKGQLHVVVKEARNLTAVRSNGFSDPFCKGYLLPEKHKSSKQKTAVRKKNCNPAWNHTFVFEDVTLDDLSDRCLELTIWDYEKLSSNDFLGGARLNLGTGLCQGKPIDWMDAKGEEMSLWRAMLDRPNVWIDGSIPLRPNMEKRKF